MAKQLALIGNTFPLKLIRGHRVTIEEISVVSFLDLLPGLELVSFWGHENTREAAEGVLGGLSLRPRVERPAVTLDATDLPSLDGQRFSQCFVLSADDRVPSRHAIGAEIRVEDLGEWHLLKLTWDTAGTEKDA